MGGPKAAVILAAGMGTRLRDVLSDRPKGLLDAGGATLVERSLTKLSACGIDDVVLVAGYRAEMYRAFLSDRFPGVELLLNPDYERTGSMHSLHVARGTLTDDFLLVESDLLYEARALTELLQRPDRDCVLVSGATRQGDEVFAYGTADRLATLSKSRLPHPPLHGEFVGISRLSPELLRTMCTHYETRMTERASYQYDDCLSDVCAAHPVRVHRIDDLLWGEIDDAAQYERALTHLLPAMQQRQALHARPA
jgi:choline kinase